MPDNSRHARALTIEFAQQIDFEASLAPLGRWGDDLIDRWDGVTLVRTMAIGPDARRFAYAAHAVRIRRRPSLKVDVAPEAAGLLDEIDRHVRGSLLADDASLAALCAADDRVRALAVRHRGVVPVLFADPFAALVRSISAQQVNLRWAATIRRRLAERYGTRHDVGEWHARSLEPAALARATVEELRALQLTRAKSLAVIGCARAAEDGRLDAARLTRLDDEELIVELTALRGIGRWSAEWFLARTLGRPRVVAGDLGVRKAIGRLYGTTGLPSEIEVRRLTGHWGAAAAHAQALALHDLATRAL